MPTRVFVNILQARSLPVMDRSTGLCDAYVKPQLKGVTFDPVQTQVMHVATVAFVTGKHMARSTARLLPQGRELTARLPRARVCGDDLLLHAVTFRIEGLRFSADLLLDVATSQTAKKTLNPVWNEQVCLCSFSPVET